ncbi:MAG TPA: AfsR/SARP family transcriptional regulator [Pseudonocardiaceae bacterium]|nr:AfsR/SARP family transcriptional regulator [Pseudonocardiaceae bacterium]
MAIQVNILGPLVLVCDSQEYDVGSARFRTLLGLLALAPGTPMSTDQLVDELWPDREISNARNALQANVVRLRRKLESITGRPGETLIRTTTVGYLLDLPADAVDACGFTSTADHGAALLASDPERAAALLERALLMWRGPVLFDVTGGPRCANAAIRLRERWLAAQEDLVDAKLAIGGERTVIPQLRQLIAEHPERERFSELLMIALYRDGRQAEAVATFHTARKWLDRELGLQPGRSLSRLYGSILRQEPQHA